MLKYCDARGVAQDSLAGLRIEIIPNDAHKVLFDSGLSARFWRYATAHAVDLRNRILVMGVQ